MKYLPEILSWAGNNSGLLTIYWLAFGYSLTYVQRFVAGCPCRIDGDAVERDHFWKVLIAGPLATIPVVVSVLLTFSESARIVAQNLEDRRARRRQKLLDEQHARDLAQSVPPYIY